MTDVTTKTCSKCGVAKPLDLFYRQKAAKDGRQNWCKDCHKSYVKAKYAEDPGPAKARERERRMSDPEAHRARRRELYATNPEKPRARTSAWRSSNLEQARARKREWAELNREHVAEYQRRWIESNRDRVNTYLSNRRGSKVSAQIGYVSFELLRLAYPNCYLCCEVLGGDVAMDHVIPLSRGGAHSMNNLRPTHPRCNGMKYDRLLCELDWYTGDASLGEVSPQRQLTVG